MKNSKGNKFVLDKVGVKQMLRSQTVMDVAVKEAAKLGKVEEKYVGTQRCWVRGNEK